MPTQTTVRPTSRGLSLYPDHVQIVEEVAQERGIRGNTFSPTIQFIITDYKRLREAERRRLPHPPIPGVDSLIGLSIRDHGKSDPVTNPDDITDELPVLAPTGNGAALIS